MLCVPQLALAGQGDEKGSKDHPAFTRMPGFRIRSYAEREFDSNSVRVGTETKSVEGRKFSIGYELAADSQPVPSPVQIVRNFAQATKKAGGEVLAEDGGSATLRLTAHGQKIWATLGVDGSGRFYTLTIVEEGGMRQDVAATAEAMAKKLASTGHVAMYGIFFDTDKASLKAESDQAIAELAKLLKADAALRVWIVGHTDNVGELAHNQVLSDARAKAVMGALVGKHGLAGNRLRAQGVGPVAPVATNRTEEGRALNRRVEIAEQ